MTTVRRPTLAIAICLAACAGGGRRDSLSILPPAAPRGVDEVYLPEGVAPPTRATVELGRRLFFDPIVSRDSSIACASCHRPAFAFGDTVPFSRGVGGRHAARNTPPLVNRAYAHSLFWDGRSDLLERTVLMPIENPNELALTLPALLERIGRSAFYGPAFRSAFPREGATEKTLGTALASYVRALRFGDSPADRYLEGDTLALSPAARRGQSLFIGSAGCSACHFGPTLSDGQFHNTGVGYGGADVGRFTVTGAEADRGRFRTPTLRDVARTAPYMHDGSLTTLEQVVAFYNRGGNPNPHLDSDIQPRLLTASDEADLVEFLKALTSRTTP